MRTLEEGRGEEEKTQDTEIPNPHHLFSEREREAGDQANEEEAKANQSLLCGRRSMTGTDFRKKIQSYETLSFAF